MHVSSEFLISDSVGPLVGSALLDKADDTGDDTSAAEDGAADDSDPDEDEHHDSLAAVVLCLADGVVAASRAAVGGTGA